MTEIVELECPGCGRPLKTDMKECPACHRLVVISTFNSVYSMPMPEVNKYVNTFQNALQNNPDNKMLNTSIAMCYLKLKLYDKALPAFEKAIEDNFDNSETFFYAAVCLLGGKKAFLAQREDIDKIEKFIGAAIMIEPRGIYYLLWAYVKLDYYERKYLKTSPNYKDMLAKAIENGCTQDDEDMLFPILDVECPEKIKIGEKTTVTKNEKSIEKKSWWTIERIVIVAATSFITIGLLLMIFCGGKSKTSESSYGKQNAVSTSQTISYKNKDEKAVIELVKKWDDIHETKNTKDFISIYAPQVEYYQQQFTPEQIVKSKNDLFVKKPGFLQVLSKIEITDKYSDGSIKVHFYKLVQPSPKEDRTKYPSYLVVKKIKGSWQIVEESDDVTDANLARKKKK